MPQEFTTPVGRIVWGHPMESQPKTNRESKQPLLDKNGKPRHAYAFGVAYPREVFEKNIKPWLDYEASLVYPNGVPRDFAWKYVDGDRDMDKDNKPYSQREGYAGHYVLGFSTEAYCPEVVKNENGSYRKLEAQEIECGYYVAVRTKVAFNQSQQSPGLYINPVLIDLAGYGKVIERRSVNPMDAFGGQQYQLPPGASATPMVQPQPQAQTAPAAPQQYAQPVQQPPMAPMTQAAPGGYPAPAHDFVQNVGQAPQQYAQPVQQPPMAPQGYPQPGNGAPPAGVPQQPPTATYAPAQPTGYAPTATSYPSNLPPGYPAR
jgi:hypothetical protein